MKDFPTPEDEYRQAVLHARPYIVVHPDPFMGYPMLSGSSGGGMDLARAVEFVRRLLASRAMADGADHDEWDELLETMLAIMGPVFSQ